jgi:hypothetical protein
MGHSHSCAGYDADFYREKLEETSILPEAAIGFHPSPFPRISRIFQGSPGIREFLIRLTKMTFSATSDFQIAGR